MRRKRGFTLIEVLVSMTILVVVFGLVTVLYARAARIRKIVIANSEILQTMTSVSDTISFGEDGRGGLTNAAGFDTTQPLNDLTFTTAHPLAFTVEITTDGILLDGLPLDIEDKITLILTNPHESNFSYYDTDATEILDPASNAEKISLVRIELWAVSNDPAMSESPPFPFVTAVRLKNHSSF